MPSSGASVRVTGRCSVHSGAAAVAVCDGCGRRMCLACAVPVRGGTVGAECLATVLGPDAPPSEPVARRQPGEVAFVVAGVGFLATLAATMLPWTNSLTSSHVRGFLGTWEFSPVSWALLSAISAPLGVAGWVLVRLRPSLGTAPVLVLLSVVGVVAAAGAALFLVAPPFATHPFLGPWLAIPAACLAAASCMVAAVRVRSGPRPSRAGR
jgi:hypothetical protein